MVKQNKKICKKLLTRKSTYVIISELRLKRAEQQQNRTLTNKQQCNPENSKREISEQKTNQDSKKGLKPEGKPKGFRNGKINQS